MGIPTTAVARFSLEGRSTFIGHSSHTCLMSLMVHPLAVGYVPDGMTPEQYKQLKQKEQQDYKSEFL